MIEKKELVLTGPVGPKACFGGKEYLYFGGTNYLGYANRSELQQGAVKAVRQYGTSFSASRETSGTNILHLELERKLAEFKASEDVCTYASGYLGNQILLSVLAQPTDVVVCDKWAHPSILEAIPHSVREVRFYAHHDIEELRKVLTGLDRAIIAVNGVETGTGEIAPLEEILEILPDGEFRVLVDDCHATGVLGENGRGTPEHYGITSHKIYQTETMSKALGSFGGFIAGTKELCDRIRKMATTYIGSTPLPPAVLGASLAAVNLAMREPHLRQTLRENAKYAVTKLVDLGFEAVFRGTPIISISNLDESSAEKLHLRLRRAGIIVPFVHYPTADSPGRLRLVVTATHTRDDIDRLCDVCQQHG